ncbi:MAG TPA: insulinase family protein [Firmicutes bacterium]|nr:insulinase family protein [Bacillota bacterium]
MYEKTVLPNGIRVVTESIPYLRSFTLGFFFKVGSQDEAPHENGISHALEHLLFKGTPTRSARAIAEAFDAVGGQLNAFTTREYTCYYARGLDEALPVALEIMADMILNASFPPEEIEKEKAVILEEIRTYDDEPEEVVHDLFLRKVWGNHPLGQTVLGSAENVAAFTRDQILAFKNEWYTSDRLLVAAVGSIRHDDLVARIEHFFGALSPGKKTPELPPPQLAEGAVEYARRRIGQVHLVFGAPGYSRVDPRRFALLLLDTAVGGGMSSRLFQGLREDRGLVYNTYSFHATYDHAGLVGVYAATAPERSRLVIDLVRQELDRVARWGLDRAELERARTQIKGSYVLSLENPSNRMSEAARSELFYGWPWDPNEILNNIDRVTLDDVQAVAADLLRLERFTLVALGPQKAERALVEPAPSGRMRSTGEAARAVARIRSRRGARTV